MANRNLRNPAVKRILQEMKEMTALMDGHGPAEFAAEALESDIFEWHFVLRGPPDTDYQGGLYHGRILLPPDYPFKPPSFIMLTPVRSVVRLCRVFRLPTCYPSCSGYPL
jgi:ubiquitin-conjugating enzyme E2 J1